jgi:hypothetical protein
LTTDTVSGIIASPQVYSAVAGDSPSRDDKAAVSVSPAVGAVVKGDDAAPFSDTITISLQSRQAVADARKEEAKREKAQKESVDNPEASGKSGSSIARVEFVYDLKGDVSVRYLDTADRLVYQVPSELTIHMREASAKTETSIDTTV